MIVFQRKKNQKLKEMMMKTIVEVVEDAAILLYGLAFQFSLDVFLSILELKMTRMEI